MSKLVFLVLKKCFCLDANKGILAIESHLPLGGTEVRAGVPECSWAPALAFMPKSRAALTSVFCDISFFFQQFEKLSVDFGFHFLQGLIRLLAESNRSWDCSLIRSVSCFLHRLAETELPDVLYRCIRLSKFLLRLQPITL